MEKSKKMKVLGIMSGTSLDGLDLALCEFNLTGKSYDYAVLKANTIPYSKEQKRKLSEIKNANAQQYFAMHHLFGKFIGTEVKKFLSENGLEADLISSHGHTVFHQPQHGFSSQLGCGATIAAITSTTTVCDFRSLDVVNGGQGAPLVPIGDKLLFGKHDACLNIGGIANISFDTNGERKAFDVCFANMALNYLAEKLDKPYDEGGKLAASGKADEFLLKELKTTLHIEKKISLARERYENLLLPILAKYRITIEDKLATFCTYAGEAIADVLNEFALKSVLVTGGGAYNEFLIDQIRTKYKGEIILPDNETIQFKEALIFAFLGYLRVNEKVNTLHTVTGAKSDTIGGAVYFFNGKL
ncbi:MAG TPA: anhydro-N-acetylmuramic acid kinase [Bacteroidia bacterium]|nr:anhydro-N-acetylmuramic acid kinase [Bacteroidia bacterium]